MTQTSWRADPRQIADPFGEHIVLNQRVRFDVLGADVEFRSNSSELLALVEEAYRGLPKQQTPTPAVVVELRLVDVEPDFEGVPPVARMVGGAGLFGVAMDASNQALVNPAIGQAVVQVSKALMRFPYHLRYELIEFAVFTLVSRVQGWLPLHAGCVGKNGIGALLVGESGAGKSTLSMQAIGQGLQFLTEDASFVDPVSLRAMGVPNYLHLRFDALAWIDDEALRHRVESSPVIRRRSGIEKYELDLRTGWARPTAGPLQIAHLVFASSEPASDGALLQPIDLAEMVERLHITQPYAAGLPSWPAWIEGCGRLRGWTLKRGAHPRDGAVALKDLLMR